MSRAEQTSREVIPSVECLSVSASVCESVSVCECLRVSERVREISYRGDLGPCKQNFKIINTD